MPTYKVKAPDGSTLRFEGPEGATESEIYAYARKQYKPQAAPKPKAAPAPRAAPKPKPTGKAAWSPGFAAAVEKSFPSNELKRTVAPAAPVNPLVGPGRVAEAVQAAAIVDPTLDAINNNRRRITARQAQPPMIATDGALDRSGTAFKQSIMRLGSGGARVLASGMEAIGDLAGAVTGADIAPTNIPGLTALRARNADVDQYVNAKIEGTQDVGEFIEDPTFGGAAQIFLEQGAASIPDMIAMANPLTFAAYVTQAAGNIGQERAENNGQEYANLANIVEAAPAALGSAYLEKLGTKYLFTGGGANPVTRVAKGIGSESLTEGGQSLLEYTGGTLGTDKGFDLATAGQQVLEGTVAGGIVGGGIKTTGEVADAGKAQIDRVIDRQNERAEQKAFAPIANKAVIDMLNPSDGVTPGPRREAATSSPATPVAEPVPAEIPVVTSSPPKVDPVTPPEEVDPITTMSDDMVGGITSAIYEGLNTEGGIKVAFLPAEIEALKAAGIEVNGGIVSNDDVARLDAERGRRQTAKAETNKAASADPVAPTAAAPTVDPENQGPPIFNPTAAPTPPSEAPPPPAAAPTPTPIASEPPTVSSPGPEGQAPQPSGSPAGLRADPGPLEEGEEYVYTPDNAKIRTRLEVVSANDLKQAEGRNQNRDRSQAGTDIQVQGIVSNFTPDRLGRSAETDRGSPIVGMDGTIESGNGRALALNKIYDDPNYADKVEAYKAFIEAQGLSTEGIDRPVLIRRRTSELSEDQLRNFVVASNKDTKLTLTGTEQAKTDADNLTPQRVALYRGGDLSKTQNADFVREFLAQLTDGERGGLMDGNVLNAAGARRIEGALLARAYDDTALLTNMIDSRDDNIRAISGALLDVVGPYTQLRDAIADGRIREDMDINKELVLAARKVSEARDRNVKIGDLLSQIDAVDPISPLTEQFIRMFYDKDLNRAVGRGKITDSLRRFMELANEETTGVDLLGDTKTTQAVDIMRQVIKERDDQPPDMFAELEDAAEGEVLSGKKRDPREELNATVARMNENVDAEVEKARASLSALMEAADDADTEAGAEEDAPYHTDNGAYGEKFENVSFTSRISFYNEVAQATGLDPDVFRLLPAGRQIALLQRLIKDRFNVTVVVDKQMQDRFAIDQMLDMIQNVQGMAHVLGIGATAISLDGKMSLKMVKKARFLGSFQPKTGEITLPQRSNSFAHEWGHALDFYLQEKMSDQRGVGLSGLLRQKGQAAKPLPNAPANVREAFVNLLNTMFFDQAAMAQKIMAIEAKMAAGTDKQKAQLQKQLDALRGGNSKARDIDSVYLRSAKAFQAGNSDYWTTPTEMFARAFEAYVSFRAATLGIGTEFIGKGDAAYLSEADERLKLTFPHGEERNAIFAAFDDLFNQLNNEGVVGNGSAAERPTAKGSSITNLNKMAIADPKSSFAREIQAWKNASVQRENERANRAPNQLTKRQRAEDALSSFFYSMSGRIRMIQRRSRSKAVGELHDKLTYREGKGVFTAQEFTRAVERKISIANSQLSNIMRKHGLEDTLNLDEQTLLRDLLISIDPNEALADWTQKRSERERLDAETNKRWGQYAQTQFPDAPAQFIAAAAEIRLLMDQEFYENQNVGIDIGYTVNGYLSRMIDLPKVDYDNLAFFRAAVQVYEIVFDKRFPSAEDVLSDPDNFKQLMKYGRRMKVPAFKAVRDINKQINALERRMEKAEPDEQLAMLGELEKLNEELIEAVGEMMDEIKPIFAAEASEAWLARINQAGMDEFDARSPSSDYTKGRSLPPEADKIMEQFYISNPVESVQTYLTQSARRTEYARSFGADGSILKELFRRMGNEGVSRQDQQSLQKIVEIVLGRQGTVLPKGVENSLSYIHAYATMRLLPRAVIASLVEPLTVGMVTGNVGLGVKALGLQVKSGAYGIADALAGVIGKSVRDARGDELAELGRAMGIITDGGAEDILHAQYGGQFGDVTRADRLVTTMFKWTGLTALTRSQRTNLLKIAQAYFDNLSGRVLYGTDAQKRQATALLQELGIENVVAFATEMKERGGLPSIDDGETQYFKDYGVAAYRFINMAIQNPTALDRPELSNNAAGRVLYGIMSFSYSFYRNIMKRQVILFNETRKRNGLGSAAAQTAFGFLPAAVSLFIGQYAISVAREYLLNFARWEEWEEEGKLGENLFWLAMTRTFSLAGVDPLIQSYSGLKYQRDLANQFVGPGIGVFLQDLQSVLALQTRNSPKNNTAEYKATKATYAAVVAPAMAFGLAKVPGGPIVAPIGGVAIAYATSPQAANNVATIVNGPKGTKNEEPGNFMGLGEKPKKEKDDKAETKIGF